MTTCERVDTGVHGGGERGGGRDMKKVLWWSDDENSTLQPGVGKGSLVFFVMFFVFS